VTASPEVRALIDAGTQIVPYLPRGAKQGVVPAHAFHALCTALQRISAAARRLRKDPAGHADQRRSGFHAGLRAALAYCKQQVRLCSAPDAKSGIACETFGCLAAAVTDDLERAIDDGKTFTYPQASEASAASDAELRVLARAVMSERKFLADTQHHDNYTDRARARDREAKAINALLAAITAAEPRAPALLTSAFDGDELRWLGDLRDYFHELHALSVRERHAPAVIRMLEHVKGMVQATIDDAKRGGHG
jgi:hypothetical protein